MAYKATLADGRQVIAVFTPQLHYRSTTSGSWDDSSNFTVGLTPAAVHDVLIDPAAGLTVTGPSKPVTVRSLTIGATATGRAVLDLSAGGTLTSLDTLFVDGSGEVDLSAGTVVAPTLLNLGTVYQSGGTVAAVVSNNGLYVFDRGTASGQVINNNRAEIQLGGPLAQVTGAVSNSGLIHGTGRVSGSLTNSSGGEVRASGGDRLTFTGGGNTNAGQISLVNGGTVEFTQTLSNAAAGVITGQGTLMARGGLTNAGQVSFTAGASNLFGPVTGTSGGKFIVTGGGTATFYNPVTLNAGSTFQVSANSGAVFLAPVSAVANAYTGTGTKYFEAGTRTLAGLTTGGSTVVDEQAAVTAAFVREASLTVNGTAAVRPAASGGGTSVVQQLAVAGSPGTWTGKLDVADNRLVIDYAAGAASPIATVADQVKSGYASGTWGGTGITTTSPATVGAMRFALGYAEASAVLGASGGQFGDQAVDGTAVLVRYTLAGDANLDGRVDSSDFNLLATNFGLTVLGGGVALAADVTPAEVAALDAFGQGAVPEPAAAGLVGVAAVAGLLGRRRGKKDR